VKTSAFSGNSNICVECLFYLPLMSIRRYSLEKCHPDVIYRVSNQFPGGYVLLQEDGKRVSLASYPFLRYSCLLCGEQLAVRTANPLCTFQVLNIINLIKFDVI
jgi:hypothetical protein